MEDELAILQEEFDEFVESRFGKKYQEWNIKQINAINDIQKTKQQHEKQMTLLHRQVVGLDIPAGFAGEGVVNALDVPAESCQFLVHRTPPC